MSDGTAGSIGTEKRRRTWKWRGGLSIQSKLLIMLLAVSLTSSAIVGIIGFVNGRDSLRDSAIDQLTTIRELRATAIENEFAAIQRGVMLDSRNASAVEGATAFVDAFAELQSAELAPEATATLESYYADSFVPALEERSGLEYEPSAFIPASPAGRYIQSLYTAGRDYDDYDAGLALADAGDDSAWTRANVEYGPYFTGLVDTLDYEDVLILDTDANVVFSAYKSVDLGVNVQAEPYANSTLTAAYEQVMRNGSLDEVATTDFERYLPSLNVPTAWVLSPIGTATNIIGVIAVQVPVDQINRVMTGGEQWEEQGLGDTGEVYLAAADQLMRSTSRLLAEDPERYEEVVVENGTAPGVAARILQVDGTVQLQPVDGEAVTEALKGRTGTAIAAEYTNAQSLVAYAPLEIDGLNWVIVAHMDQDEAFAPVSDFTRTLLLSLLGILLGVSLLSLLLAQVFTRPVHRLVGAVHRVAEGDLDVQVPQGSRDEFGDLGSAFNDMASSLRIKQELIDEQQVENEKLLLTLMPERVAERYKKGDEAISEAHGTCRWCSPSSSASTTTLAGSLPNRRSSTSTRSCGASTRPLRRPASRRCARCAAATSPPPGSSSPGSTTCAAASTSRRTCSAWSSASMRRTGRPSASARASTPARSRAVSSPGRASPTTCGATP